MSDNLPLIFRAAQIDSFVSAAKDASCFTGPGGVTYNDSHIEMVLEEVEAHEADLSAARISIEQYLIDSLNKEPDNPIFLRMRDAFRPIFDEVIQIEIKMYGAPKYHISTANNTAEAWRMDAAAIAQVHLPQDVLSEAAKYNFTTIKPSEFKLPEQPETPGDVRRKFFAALPADEDSSEDRERAWLQQFKKEASYELIDRALFICNFHDQVSTFITEQLVDYVKGERSKELMDYEQGCDVPEVDLVPNEFIITAANSAKRAFFSALYLSGTKRDEFKKFISEQVDFIREEGKMPADDYEMDSDIEQTYPLDYVLERGFMDSMRALIKMYGKHPLFESDLLGFKLVFKFIKDDAPGMLSHFYRCFNDMISYYEERHFFESMTTCNVLKDFIADLAPQEGEPTEAEVEQANEAAQEQRAAASSTGIYIE
jgi:hypothetical protein